MKMPSAIQFTSCTTIPRSNCYWLFADGKINDGGENRADDHPKQLKPVEERHAHERGLESIVEGGPQGNRELDDEEQVPPAPSAALLVCIDHAGNSGNGP